MDGNIKRLKRGQLCARGAQDHQYYIRPSDCLGDLLHLRVGQNKACEEVERVAFIKSISVTYFDHTLWRVHFGDVDPSQNRWDNSEVPHVLIVVTLGALLLGLLGTARAACRPLMDMGFDAFLLRTFLIWLLWTGRAAS